MSKQFLAVLAVIVLIFVGIFAFGGNKSSTKSSTSSVKPTEHIRGTSSTGVTVVEYGDFQCPYCEEYAPVVSQVQQEFNDKVSFQFRNFPLVNVHANAFAAARSAEAAGLQNKYWEMHEALYNYSNWIVWTKASDPTPYFNQYAEQIGANVAQFKTDFVSSKVNDLINADTDAGNKLGIQGTPTFFINGKQVTIAAKVADFEKVLNAEIAKKTPATSSTPAAQ